MTYPIAILEDRYGGAYSHGPWLAIEEADERVDDGMRRVVWCMEEGPGGSDGDAMMFWMDPPSWIAVGNTPDAAVAALKAKVEAKL